MEQCLLLDSSPYGNNNQDIGGTLPSLVLIFDGRNVASGLSDYLRRTLNFNNGSVTLNFVSDGTAEMPLPLPNSLTPANLEGCFTRQIVVNDLSIQCTTEDGTTQTAGTAVFFGPNNATTTDTVRFASDAETPEPNSLLTLGSGLVSLCFLRFGRLSLDRRASRTAHAGTRMNS